MGTRLEAVLRAGEAHRQRALVPTGALEMEDFNDDALRLILDKVVSGNPKRACEAAANWCALNKRHRDMCQDGGNTLWTTLTRRIFGTDTQATTIDPSGNAQKNFYALCERAAAYRQGDRMIKDHPQDKRVRVFIDAAREGLDNNLSAALENLGDSRRASWYSARKMDKALFSRKEDAYGVEEGKRHRDLLSWLLNHFVEIFDNLAEFRRIRGPERDRTTTLVTKFFAHAVYFQASLQDFEDTSGYADKDDKLEVLETFEQTFRQALALAMVVVNFRGSIRHDPIPHQEYEFFYAKFVREDIRNLVTQVKPSDDHITMDELNRAMISIVDSV